MNIAMRAITVCQPYAALICLPESDPRHKRIENRTWATPYRGPLLIHAGKSRAWLAGENYGLDVEALPFGAIVAAVELVGVFRLVAPKRAGELPGPPQWALDKFHWLRTHRHIEGPVCHVYQNVRPLARPVPYRGAQGFFGLDAGTRDAVLEQLGGTL